MRVVNLVAVRPTISSGGPLKRRDVVGVAHDPLLRRSFQAGVNLQVSSSEAIPMAREGPLMTAVCRALWHGCGTEGGTPPEPGSRLRRSPSRSGEVVGTVWINCYNILMRRCRSTGSRASG